MLGRLDYSETSQILVLFTCAHGKVRTIAKGVKRGTKNRFAVGIDLLEVGNVVFSSRQERGDALATLTEWKQTLALSGLRTSLARLNAAQYVAETTARLTEDWDPAPTLFGGLKRTLSDLSNAEVSPALNGGALAAVVAYQQLLLNEIGAAPRFDACILCGRMDDLTHFSSFEGGMICRHCEPTQVEKRAVSHATLATLQVMEAGVQTPPSDGTSQEALSETVSSPGSPVEAAGTKRAAPVQSQTALFNGPFSLLNYHISHILGREPVMAIHLVPRLQQRRVE